jgi:hypothetical protein
MPPREIAAHRLARVPRSRIRYLEVTFYRGEVGEAVGWGLSGTVSTLSHGLVLLLSAPVWLITTGTAGAIESSAGTVTYRAARGSLTAEAFAGLRKYARFPQGLPEGFTLQPPSPPPLAPPPAPATPVPPGNGPASPPQPSSPQPSPAQPSEPAGPPGH